MMVRLQDQKRAGHQHLIRRGGQALCAELARLDEFGPLLTFTWVRKLSVVSALLRSTIRKQQRVSSLPDTKTTDPQNVACSGCSPRLECEVFRCQQGFPAHTLQNSCVRCATGRVSESDSWRCLGNKKTVYGMEETPADFDEHFGKVAENLCGESGSLCSCSGSGSGSGSCRCIVASLHRCIVVLLCCCVAVLRCCGVAVLLCCGVEVLKCCGVAVLRCCGVAVLRCCCLFVWLLLLVVVVVVSTISKGTPGDLDRYGGAIFEDSPNASA